MNLQLIIALITAALDFFHLGLVYPILAEMVVQPSGSLSWGQEEWQRTLSYALFIAAFPLAQFIGAPLLGKLSDTYGRRKLLFITVAGSGLGMAVCALGVLLLNPTLVLIGRLTGGIMGANISLAYAAIADFSTPENKVKNLALIPLSASLGFVLGPLAAGLMSGQAMADYGPSFPLWCAVFLSFLNWCALLFFEDRSKTAPKTENSASLLRERSIWSPIAITFLMITANFLLVQFIGPFAINRLDINLTQVSWLYVNVSLSCALGHILLTRNLAAIATPKKLLPWSLAALAISLYLISQSFDLITLHLTTALAMLCCAVAYTNAIAFLSGHASAERQGEVMGLGVSAQCLAEWLPPLALGAFAATIPSLPMYAGSLCCLLAIGILLIQPKTIGEAIG